MLSGAVASPTECHSEKGSSVSLRAARGGAGGSSRPRVRGGALVARGARPHGLPAERLPEKDENEARAWMRNQMSRKREVWRV